MDKEIDIEKLTREVEAGNGCSIVQAMDGLSLQAQLRAIKEIAITNQLHRLKDKSIPTIEDNVGTTDRDTGGNRIYLTLEKVTPGLFTANVTLFSEQVDITRNSVRYSCKDSMTDGSEEPKSTTKQFY